jgi:hypothetical protein
MFMIQLCRVENPALGILRVEEGEDNISIDID